MERNTMAKILLNNWVLKCPERQIVVDAQVPGDITIDLFNADIVENPYFGMNKENMKWIAETNFTYECHFNIDDNTFNCEAINLSFAGIDLFSDIELNGVVLGHTENMFLRYTFDIKNIAKKKDNVLKVHMISTINEMNKIDTHGYFGTFNVERLFIRKAQCHFGWDWAPNLSGYGIWESVTIEGDTKDTIKDIYCIPAEEGWVTLLAELNYTVRHQIDFQGQVMDPDRKLHKNDMLVFSVSSQPDGECDISQTVKVDGQKRFANLQVPEFKLWWPVGYGEQPLYNYRVELLRDGVCVGIKEGKFAFRKVELIEQPKNNNILGYGLKINGKEIFVKGANWVPCDCFTGTIKDEKYEKLIQMALNSNFNMLRVWGGGIYEKDIFYDLCDKYGILVWQDFMLACGDIPDEDQAWMNNMIAECEYQVRRLRNHASIVYWCGGNEKTGSYGLQVSHGDFFINYVLQGLVFTLDKTRPYARQSPCSITDIGNDSNSGESHCGCMEPALVEGMNNYRKMMASNEYPLVSECGGMGPDSIETIKKVYPEDKLWPMNEYWEARLLDNPYAGIRMPFTQRQLKLSEELYGKANTLNQFVAKASLLYSEIIKAEAEYARSKRDITSGFLNWMYSDIWPTGTWAVVDYYTEPKPVLYQMKKSFEKVLVTFVKNKLGKTELVVVNDDIESKNLSVVYGVKNLHGECLRSEKCNLTIESGKVVKFEVSADELPKNSYLFVAYEGDVTGKTLYSDMFWSNMDFQSDYTYSVNTLSDTEIEVTVNANKFAKQVFIHFENNFEYTYSDNYFDVEAGESVTIKVTNSKGIDASKMCITDFAKEIQS